MFDCFIMLLQLLLPVLSSEVHDSSCVFITYLSSQFEQYINNCLFPAPRCISLINVRACLDVVDRQFGVT